MAHPQPGAVIHHVTDFELLSALAAGLDGLRYVLDTAVGSMFGIQSN